MTRLPAAALFDLDGVLIDTEGLYTEIWADIERTHPTGIDDFAHKIKGSTLQRILSTHFPDPAVQADIVAMLKEREDAMVYELFAGVADFLADLQLHHIPAAIVTSSNAPKMERLFGSLKGFRDFFAAVITDGDVTHSKPHPECYLTAARRLGADIADCVVFEDSFSGLEAGRAAGAHVVALATTNSRESLLGKADLIIDGFTGLGIEELAEKLG